MKGGARPAPGSAPGKVAGHYDVSYGHFDSELQRDIRRRAFGEDIGQNSWLTVSELQGFVDGLRLAPGRRLLDVACGSGGPSLRVAATVGCSVVGIDLNEHGIAQANAAAAREGLADRATYHRADAQGALPFPGSCFDAILCVDAICHFADRRSVLREWARVLAPGGRVAFTDPVILTGPVSDAEIAVRSAVGFYLFVPPGEDERLLREAGFELERTDDLTGNLAAVARRRHDARAAHEAELRRLDGDATFERQQELYGMAARLARERRLSRLAFLAAKAG